MTQFDDPGPKAPRADTQPDGPENPKGVQVYERPARTLPPAALIFLFVILGLALLWFLFAYVF